MERFGWVRAERIETREREESLEIAGSQRLSRRGLLGQHRLACKSGSRGSGSSGEQSTRDRRITIKKSRSREGERDPEGGRGVRGRQNTKGNALTRKRIAACLAGRYSGFEAFGVCERLRGSSLAGEIKWAAGLATNRDGAAQKRHTVGVKAGGLLATACAVLGCHVPPSTIPAKGLLSRADRCQPVAACCSVAAAWRGNARYGRGRARYLGATYRR